MSLRAAETTQPGLTSLGWMTHKPHGSLMALTMPFVTLSSPSILLGALGTQRLHLSRFPSQRPDVHRLAAQGRGHACEPMTTQEMDPVKEPVRTQGGWEGEGPLVSQQKATENGRGSY